jgi:acetylornithine deacetylase/succinyl-diaminopimelate desuccinylase-like protein
MINHRQAALDYASRHKTEFLNDMAALVAIPSISTDPEAKADVRRAAEWIAARLGSLGMEKVAVIPTTAGHPVVYGEWLGAPGKPTVLVYGHYDVQPVDPLELWQSPPFETTVRGENVYGRGTSDMKAQDVAVFSALESIVKTGELPVNVKFLLEGEEEIGSPSLDQFILDHKDLLKADAALNPDAGMIGVEYPAITYGLRGLAAFEVRVYGPSSDLHSGLYGGVVHNPAVALAELIAGMHNANGSVLLPGFYDDVRPLSAEERAEFARLPMDTGHYLEMTGVPMLWGEAKYTPLERVGARPTLEINGLLSGFTGQGTKTVLPAQAMAKITCRLVPDQDPEKIYRSLRKYLEQNAPKTIRWELIKMQGGPASISDRNSAAVQAMCKALETVWGSKPLFRREGGSIPVVAQMQSILGVESVLTGFGLPDDNLHAPNEKQHLPTWYKGIDSLIHFFFNL